MYTYFRLAYMFFATGMFSIGGGLAILPFLYDISDRTGWYTSHDIANMIAVSESVPGAIGISMSTYAGFKTAGIIGGLIAALAIITPGILIILIVAKFLDKFRENYFVDSAFYGLRAASLGLIASVTVSITLPILIDMNSCQNHEFISILNIKAVILAVLILVISHIWKKIHPIIFIISAAIIGILFSF